MLILNNNKQHSLILLQPRQAFHCTILSQNLEYANHYRYILLLSGLNNPN